MIPIVKKELRVFFSGLTGYISLAVFLLVTGVIVFVLPESNLLDAGYASMDAFFEAAPLIMLFLIPAITMKSFSDEYRNGTFEVLRTAPISARRLVGGKFLSSLLISMIAVSFTLVYVFSIWYLSSDGIDAGGIVGSYLGLVLLCAVYVSIGVFSSSLQSNALVSFLLSALISYIFYALFSSLSELDAWRNDIGYAVSLLGIQSHYRQISRGYLDSRDLLYFLSLVLFFLHLTTSRIKSR
jgi:ABC-2 type transport system permease protein